MKRENIHNSVSVLAVALLVGGAALNGLPWLAGILAIGGGLMVKATWRSGE